MKKNFLHICLSESWGGLEMAVTKWNEILHENKHKNLNICTPDSPLLQDLKNKGFRTLEWDSAHYFSPDFTFKLRQLIKTKKIDVIVLQNLRDLWIISPALWGNKKIKLVGFAQMLTSVKKKDLLHRLVYNRLNFLCTLTDWQQSALKDFLPVPANKYHTIPNFVDTKIFNPKWKNSDFRNNLGISNDHFLIGIIGRIDEQKGQKELLVAFSNLIKKYKNLKLMIVGDPTIGEKKQENYFLELHNFVKEKQLEKSVFFKSFQSGTHFLYPNFDLFVLASHQETFGFVVVEAMASGTPVLGTQAGGVPEILNQGQFGYLCQPKSSDSLEKQIAHIIDNPKESREKADKALIKILEFYDRNQVYERFIKLIS
jgi:glycosyltransferase involved in cell wall biosynthesis